MPLPPPPPSPPSPITLLAQGLNAAPSLIGFATVLAGKNNLTKLRAPPSIVIYPQSGPLEAAADIIDSFADVNLTIAARLWGSNLDQAWDLRARLVAALWSQGIGDPSNPDDTTAGFYFKLVDEVWDVIPDASQQGQELEVLFSIRSSASEKSLAYGEVDAESLTKTAILEVAMLAGDSVANVDATVGYATTGTLHIDGEQMAYTGLTSTSFTGLVRGINNTVAAAHAVGAIVSLTPT